MPGTWNLSPFGETAALQNKIFSHQHKTQGSFGFQVWYVYIYIHLYMTCVYVYIIYYTCLSPPMDSHSNKWVFMFPKLKNQAAPARGLNGWWFASWVPSGNVWSHQWNSRHSSVRRTDFRNPTPSSWRMGSSPNIKWLAGFGPKVPQTFTNLFPPEWRMKKIRVESPWILKDMSRFPG